MCGYSASDIKKKIILELEVCRQSPVYLRGSLNARFLMERDTGDQSIGKSNCLFWWLKMGLAVRCVSLVVWVAVFEYYCNQSLPELNEAIVHLWPGQPCYCLELQLKWSLAHLSQYSNYPKTLATTIEGFKKKKFYFLNTQKKKLLIYLASFDIVLFLSILVFFMYSPVTVPYWSNPVIL